MAKILITDGGYSHTLEIIRSLNKLGNVIDCIGHPLCLSRFSKSINKCAYNQTYFNENNIEKFLRFLEKNNYDYLIPIGAKSVDLVNKFRDQIQEKTIINLAPKESINICLKKRQLLQIARELNIPTPKTFTKLELENPQRLNRKFLKKIVIKPSSELSNKKVEYIKINDNSKIKNLDFDNSLVQEYIEGAGYGFFAIYDNGILKDFFMHRRIRENPISGGSSVCAESIFDNKLFNYGTKLLDNLNWHGVAMVEFKKDYRSGEFFLMEINPKFWASHDLAIASGINFAEKYLQINNIKNLNIKKNKTYEVGYILNKKFQWLARDLRTNLFNPIRLFKVFYYFLILKANNNLYIRDPFPTLYLIMYAFLSPVIKSRLFKEIYSFLYKIKNYGLKTTLIRTFSEKTGIVLLKYSLIEKNIAIGSQPSLLGLFFLSKNGFKNVLNLRSDFSYKKDKINKKFNLKEIPIDEFASPTFVQLNKGADYINEVLLSNQKIYVHCREGISRAPYMLVAYLIKYQGYNYENAIKKILKSRYFINILHNQMQQIKNFQNKLDEC